MKNLFQFFVLLSLLFVLGFAFPSNHIDDRIAIDFSQLLVRFLIAIVFSACLSMAIVYVQKNSVK